MTTIKTSKISLNTFDDKRFYVNNIKSYPHKKNLYLFKRDLVQKINNTTLELDLGRRSGFNGKNQLVNNILEITTTDDRRLIEAAIRLYNDL